MAKSTQTKSTAYIVGAGFSSHAGLPLQEEFTSKLLEPRQNEDDPHHDLVKFLSNFTNQVFDHKKTASARYWPNLEDIFTSIDLAANTGHHLGFDFPPAKLRTVRRALLTRIINILNDSYGRARKLESSQWRQLKEFFEKIDTAHSAFISINWDTVIERRLQEVRNLSFVSYKCGEVAAEFPRKGNEVRLTRRPQRIVPVIKIHGSINWLYCDSCRRLHCFPPSQAREIESQLLSPEEWELIHPKTQKRQQWTCSRCPEVCLGTRIATLSYLKALDFPMFQKSWFSAERVLRNASRWVFIGYSLPAADYEFKYLLKRVQISRQEKPEIVLVTGGTDPELTYSNYQRFFGRVMDRNDGYFGEGLSTEAIQRIT
jgi:hypothetical protein